MRLSLVTACSLSCLTIGSAAYSTNPSEKERLGKPISGLDSDHALNPKKMTEALVRGDIGVDLRKQPAPPFKPDFDSTKFKADPSSISNLCFSSVGPWVPYDGDSFTDEATTPVRAWTCESRDSVVKALGFTSVFLKGTGYVCSFTPLPQAQATAKVFDIASYASSTIGLVVSVTNCENKLEDKFNALLKACDELKSMNIDCQGVDNTPF